MDFIWRLLCFTLSKKGYCSVAFIYRVVFIRRWPLIQVDCINQLICEFLYFRYIYTDDADLDGIHVMECLYAAKKYALHGLVDKCLQFLENAINVGSACTIHEQAKFYGETILQRKCFDYIVENSNGVFRSDGFRSLSKESLYEILECDHLASNEAVVFAAAKFWAENQCKVKELEVTPENIRSCLVDIIYLIRFPVMSIETFARQVATTNILTSEEMLNLYHHLATKSSSAVPATLGKFSCRRRTVVLRVTDSNLTQSYEGCIVLLNTSGPVKLVSVKGDFVHQVTKIYAGRQDIAFDSINSDHLNLKEPLIVRPHSGNIQIVFQLKEDVNSDIWSANVNISRSVKDATINVRRVPCGLHSLVFEEVL